MTNTTENNGNPLDASQASEISVLEPAGTRVERVKGRGGGLVALAFAGIVDGFEGGLVNTARIQEIERRVPTALIVNFTNPWVISEEEQHR